jgi:SAM-dependent methyltransferase
MLDAIDALVGTRFRALDLGCGTGSTSERLLRRFPGARSVAIDHDPILLRIGSTGLGTMSGRLRWVDADLRGKDWVRSLPVARFDVVVSTTALHWLDPTQLHRLYDRLARLLRPGGWFLNGDRLAYARELPRLREGARVARHRPGGSPSGESWRAWWQAVMRDPRLAAEAELHRQRYPEAHGDTRTLDFAGHVRALRRAGFREVGLVWAQWDNRVLAAMR